MVDKVKGYKDLTQEKVAIVNEFKNFEEQLLRVIEQAQAEARAGAEYDPRWLSIAFTKFQEAFMALNRGIFAPGRVTLPEDSIEKLNTRINERLGE
jgi:hypothetical protein